MQNPMCKQRKTHAKTSRFKTHASLVVDIVEPVYIYSPFDISVLDIIGGHVTSRDAR